MTEAELEAYLKALILGDESGADVEVAEHELTAKVLELKVGDIVALDW